MYGSNMTCFFSFFYDFIASDVPISSYKKPIKRKLYPNRLFMIFERMHLSVALVHYYFLVGVSRGKRFLRKNQ